MQFPILIFLPGSLYVLNCRSPMMLPLEVIKRAFKFAKPNPLVPLTYPNLKQLELIDVMTRSIMTASGIGGVPRVQPAIER